jgi:hypothetical protein
MYKLCHRKSVTPLLNLVAVLMQGLEAERGVRWGKAVSGRALVRAGREIKKARGGNRYMLEGAGDVKA